jgi:hypothetical protein
MGPLYNVMKLKGFLNGAPEWRSFEPHALDSNEDLQISVT